MRMLTVNAEDKKAAVSRDTKALRNELDKLQRQAAKG